MANSRIRNNKHSTPRYKSRLTADRGSQFTSGLLSCSSSLSELGSARVRVWVKVRVRVRNRVRVRVRVRIRVRVRVRDRVKVRVRVRVSGRFGVRD